MPSCWSRREYIRCYDGGSRDHGCGRVYARTLATLVTVAREWLTPETPRKPLSDQGNGLWARLGFSVALGARNRFVAA